MFKPHINLHTRLARFRKAPLPSSIVSDAESRVWQNLRQKMAEDTLMHPTQTKNHSFFFFPVIATSLVLALAAGSYTYFLSRNLPTTSTNTTGPSISMVLQSESSEGRSVKTISTSSYGYVANPTKKSTSFLGISAAYADGTFDSSDYSLTEFGWKTYQYSNTGAQAHITARNLVTGEVTQITDSADTTETLGKFSSVTQILAYETSPWSKTGPSQVQAPDFNNPCTVKYSKITPGSSPISISNPTGVYCMRPISWSPDGRFLALTTYGISNSEPLAIYDTTTRTTTVVQNPTDNAWPSITGGWLNNTTLTSTYNINDTPFNENFYTINALTAKTTQVSNEILGLTSYKIAGSTVYYTKTLDGVLNIDPADVTIHSFSLNNPTKITNYPTTNGTTDFTFRLTSGGDASSIIYSTFKDLGDKSLYTEYSFPIGDSTIQELTLSDNTVKTLSTRKDTDILSILGWNAANDSIILTQSPASKAHTDESTEYTEYHAFNVTSNTDTNLITDSYQMQKN